MKIVPPFDVDALPPLQTLAAIGATAAALALAYALVRPSSSSAKRPTKSPPARKIHSLDSKLPLLGDLFEFGRNASRMHEWIAEHSLALNGEPWRIHIPGQNNMVVITSPDLMEEIEVTQFDNFPRGQRGRDVLEDFLGATFVVTDGEKWYHQRKTASKFFTAKALRLCMMTSMQKNLSQMYDVIDASIAQQETFDIDRLLHDFAVQTFAEAGLGIELNIIGRDEHHPLDGVEDITPNIVRRTQLPPFIWKLERWLNIGQERQIATTMKSIRAWLDAVVNESLEVAGKRLAARREEGAKPPQEEIKSVVELFLEQGGDGKDGLRAEDLVDFILTFLLGSRGTSAMALEWIFLVVAKHPHVEERIRREMAEKLGDVDIGSTFLTTEHVSKLVYLDATIKEVLRLYPTFAMAMKEAAIDTVIGDDLVIKKGEVMILHAFSMGRLPSIWGPDAAEFKPERWIDEATGELINVPSNKFVAFGTGPRICIGMKLALVELRVVTANLFSRYHFSLATPNDLSHVVSVELMPATPVVLHATRVGSTNREKN